MFCPRCGTQNADGTRFCACCGAPLADQPQDTAGQYQPGQPEPPAYGQPRNGPYQSGQYQSGPYPHGQPPYAQPPYGQPPVKKKKKRGCLIAVLIVAVLLIGLIVAAALSGGELSFTTANVAEAYTTSGVDPVSGEPLDHTDTFSEWASGIYAAAYIKNAPDDTEVTAIWYHIPTDSSLASEDVLSVSGNTWISFSLTNPNGFTPGTYKIEILIDGKVAETLEFQVE